MFKAFMRPAYLEPQSCVLTLLIEAEPVFQITLPLQTKTCISHGEKQVAQVVFNATHIVAGINIEIQALVLSQQPTATEQP